MSFVGRTLDRRRMVATLLASASAMISRRASAQAAADFYKGKTIRLIVSTTPGGGYDTHARNMARYFGRYVPGNPQIIVDNMPGAGSLLAMNYMYNSAPRDGTVMCLFQHSIFATPFLRPGAVRFDLRKYGWLGSLGSDIGVMVVRKDAPVQTTEDLFTRDVITGMAAGVSVIPHVFNAILGTRMKIISGYAGNNEVVAAFERNEVQAIGEWSWEDLKTTKANWVKSGFVRPLLQIGIDPAPDLPDVPLAQNLAKTNEDRQIIEIFASQRQLAFPMVLPPQVPSDRLAALRDAFVAIGQDEDFKRDQMRDGGLEPKLMAGADAAQFVDRTFGSLSSKLAQRITSFGLE